MLVWSYVFIVINLFCEVMYRNSFLVVKILVIDFILLLEMVNGFLIESWFLRWINLVYVIKSLMFIDLGLLYFFFVFYSVSEYV